MKKGSGTFLGKAKIYKKVARPLFSTTIPPHNCPKNGDLDVRITDVNCGKVILDVDGEYGDFADLNEFMRELEGVLKIVGGEAGILLSVFS